MLPERAVLSADQQQRHLAALAVSFGLAVRGEQRADTVVISLKAFGRLGQSEGL